MSAEHSLQVVPNFSFSIIGSTVKTGIVIDSFASFLYFLPIKKRKYKNLKMVFLCLCIDFNNRREVTGRRIMNKVVN